MSKPEAEDEILLPVDEPPPHDADVPPGEAQDDWLDQKPFDPAGR